MGLCYSLRPILFGDTEDAPCADPESRLEDARPDPAPAGAAGNDAAGTPLPRGGGQSAGSARPSADKPKGKRRLPEQLRAEEREAAREARRVSRGIDRMLREQKRDLQQTHRLLLLGRSSARAGTTGRGAQGAAPRRVGDGRRRGPGGSDRLGDRRLRQAWKGFIRTVFCCSH